MRHAKEIYEQGTLVGRNTQMVALVRIRANRAKNEPGDNQRGAPQCAAHVAVPGVT